MPVHSDALEDPLRVQAEEHLAQAVVLGAEQAVGRHLDVVEEEEELLLGRADLHRDERALDSGRIGVDDEQRQAAPGVLVDAGARDDEHRVGLVDAGDVGLGAAEPVDVAVARRGGREVVAVGAGVGLGDREHHLPAVGQRPGASASAARRYRSARQLGRRSRPTPARAAADIPAPPASSLTTTSSLRPPPPPPCSSGRCTERIPGSATACQSSSAFSPVTARSGKYSCPNDAAIRLTDASLASRVRQTR